MQRSAAAAPSFSRTAEWPVASNASTAAEILAASADGQTLIYTDSPGKQLGFVDIADPAAPEGSGVLALDGEPTSVVVVGGRALVAVAPSGHLAVVDLATRQILARCNVGGQPDSVAASPDGAFLAVAIENERDEDLNDGVMPQMPAGHLTIFDLQADGMPANCEAARMVDLTGLAAVAGDDPEPEYVAIVDLASGQVVDHFSAGTVDLQNVDLTDDGAVVLAESASGVPREPDVVAWVDDTRLVTANEGDYEGGSRSVTIFTETGTVLWDSGAETEQLAAEKGVYPDDRSPAKGTEPETVATADFNGSRLILVALERANALVVYEVQGQKAVSRQILATGVGPEGVLPLPARNLLAVANEADPEEGIPSFITLFQLTP